MSPRCGPQMKISPQLYDMTRLLAIMRNNFLSACPIRLFLFVSLALGCARNPHVLVYAPVSPRCPCPD
ncbi:hypothetical protein AWE19_13280 [Escherichia coli]|nr:hypothetical protein AWE17_01970 [Escherichia coli]PDO14560.1 hypothetical protein AWE19_13280 [Escherichia coli]PDO34940.1 hypothetical protein AWE20_09860 [Escherichia coli]PDO56781.1 hypothetical protein AWE18_21900 [Escherichia coli]